jgi:hypothetical protein
MGFLTRHANKEEPDEEETLEEQYKKLFPKIGRDFVAREDLEGLILIIINAIDPLGVLGLSIDDSAAKNIAERYQRLLKKGKEGGESKRDLTHNKKDKKDK